MILRASIVAAIASFAMPGFALDLQGHRGARGLMPENTLPAFAAALSLGVTTLELDAGITSDGTVVIAHDRNLNTDIARAADGSYVPSPGPAIRSLSLSEVGTYDVGVLRPGSSYARQFAGQKRIAGTRIPTLAEVAALVRKSGNTTVRFNIETKLSPAAPDQTADPETFAGTLVAALRAEGLAGRTAIQSFDWRTLKAVQRMAPEIPTVCLTIARGANDNVQAGRAGASPWLAGLDVDAFGGSVPKLVKAAGCAVWSPFFRDLTAEALAESKSLDLGVVVWTVNDPADMARLIDMGVDGIITDYPDRLRTAAAEKNIALPAPTPVEP